MKTAIVDTPHPLNRGELSLSELMERAPAAFVRNSAQPTDARYSFIETATILKKLAKLEYHFFPVDAEQTYKRKTNDNLQKHVIVLRSEDERLNIRDLKGKLKETVQLYLTNSHDGTTNFTLSLSIHKFDTGLDFNVPESIISSIRIKHVGEWETRLRYEINNLLEGLPRLYKRIDMMKRKNLTDEQTAEFAIEACKLRFKKDIQIDEDALISSIKKKTVWNVCSKLQEILTIGGDFYYYKDSNDMTGRKIRAVNYLPEKEKINNSVFQLADQYVFGA